MDIYICHRVPNGRSVRARDLHEIVVPRDWQCRRMMHCCWFEEEGDYFHRPHPDRYHSLVDTYYMMNQIVQI